MIHPLCLQLMLRLTNEDRGWQQEHLAPKRRPTLATQCRNLNNYISNKYVFQNGQIQLEHLAHWLSQAPGSVVNIYPPLVEPAWLWDSQSRMATPLGLEKYGRIDFSLKKWTKWQSLTSSHGSLACVLLLLAVFLILLVHFFLGQNRFSHIFPAPGGSPLLTVNLTVKLARLTGQHNWCKIRLSFGWFIDLIWFGF